MTPTIFRRVRVLVTGGAGFIGSALVWALNRRGGENIVVCDRLGTDEKWRNLAPLRFADYVEADALLPRLQSGALGRFDLILHLGACSAATELDAGYLIRNNFEFTKDLAAWALAKQSRFVYASSAATYGDGSAGMEGDETKLDSLRPLNMYGYSKHLFDLHAWRTGFLHQMVGLKYFNVYGPNEDHKGDMRSLVHKSTAQVRAEGLIRLFKSRRPDYRDGEQKRDFLYVKDAVAMTLHLAATPSAQGCSTSAAARPAPGWTWPAPSSPRWTARRTSGSSRCRRPSATNTSISPRPTCPPALGGLCRPRDPAGNGRGRLRPQLSRARPPAGPRRGVTGHGQPAGVAAGILPAAEPVLPARWKESCARYLRRRRRFVWLPKKVGAGTGGRRRPRRYRAVGGGAAHRRGHRLRSGGHLACRRAGRPARWKE